MKPPKGPDNKFKFSFPPPVLRLHPTLLCTSKAPGASPEERSGQERGASMGSGRQSAIACQLGSRPLGEGTLEHSAPKTDPGRFGLLFARENAFLSSAMTKNPLQVINASSFDDDPSFCLPPGFLSPTPLSSLLSFLLLVFSFLLFSDPSFLTLPLWF